LPCCHRFRPTQGAYIAKVALNPYSHAIFALQTRSGSEFSPWAGSAARRIITPAADVDFDFEQLVANAVVQELELEDDNTEGDELVSALDAVSLSTPPLSRHRTDFPPVDSTTAAHSSPPTSSLDPMPGPSYGKSNSAVRLMEDTRRKRRGHAKRAVERLEAKRAAPYGQYVIKPMVLSKYVRPATSINTKLDAMKLKHTKYAYTGGRDNGGQKRIFELHELVGENSQFKFKLECWDGQ
jgi:hypothetical protein